MNTITPSMQQYEDCLAFEDLPPFPNDVDTAPLLRLNLRKIAGKDAQEEERLWRSCCDLGFFYLDLRETHDGESLDNEPTVDGDTLLAHADDLFTIATKLFDLPEPEKQQYDLAAKGSYFGYKGLGKTVLDREKDIRDKNEFWNVSKDDLFGLSQPLPNPAVLTSARTRHLIKEYMRLAHAIVTLLLTRLNDRLALPRGTLQSLHRLHAVSGDQIRWVKSPPQPADARQTALGEHTDFGSVTVLFNRLGGLQVLPPGARSWLYVRPLKGHCVVNLGDAMVKFTAGVLRSNLHRVVNPPGLQEQETRYSLVYFSRPEDDVVLKALRGSSVIDAKRNEAVDPPKEEEENITAKDWILRRALGRRIGAKSVESGCRRDHRPDSVIETN